MKGPGWLRILLGGVLLMGAPGLCFGQVMASTPVLPVTVLVQSPAETKTELQIFCLFRAKPVTILGGSLFEADQKLHGILGQIWKPGLFGGELGETILLTP